VKTRDEWRFVTFGMSSSGRLLVRHASRAERKLFRIQALDFGALVRGKYVQRLQTSSNVVVLDPDVANMFPNAAAVNAALRSLGEIAKRAGSRRNRPH